MRLLLPVLILIAATTFAGCGGDDSDDDASSSPTAGATQPAAAAASPTVGEQGDGDEPRTHTSNTFSPRASVTVGEGWTLAVDSASEFVVEHDSAFAEEQAFVGLFRVNRVWSPANFSTPEPPPDDLIDWMVNHRDLDITDGPREVTIGGFSGVQIDVSVDTEYDVILFDEFEAHFRDRFRIVQLDVNGERVVVASGAFVAGAFDAVQPLVEPVVASIAFE